MEKHTLSALEDTVSSRYRPPVLPSLTSVISADPSKCVLRRSAWTHNSHKRLRAREPQRSWRPDKQADDRRYRIPTWECSPVAGGNAREVKPPWLTLAVSYSNKHALAVGPRNPSPRFLPKWMENLHSHWKLSVNVYVNFLVTPEIGKSWVVPRRDRVSKPVSSHGGHESATAAQGAWTAAAPFWFVVSEKAYVTRLPTIGTLGKTRHGWKGVSARQGLGRGGVQPAAWGNSWSHGIVLCGTG